jgi:hypothetical protein
MMANKINEWTYPIFGKLRTVESKTGREEAFQRWQEFVLKNARLIGPSTVSVPVVKQDAEQEVIPLFGLDPRELEKLSEEGRRAQTYYAERQFDLGVVTQVPDHNRSDLGVVTQVPDHNLAVTSSHNLWLDAAARSGILYIFVIAMTFCYVVWLLSMRISADLPAPLAFAYWLMAAAWGIASQFDDEHWLYHIPYLSLFFLPVLAVPLRARLMTLTSNSTKTSFSS